MRRFRLSDRLRLLLRTGAGFTALGVGTSVCGSVVVTLLLVLQDIPQGDSGSGVVLYAAIGYIALAAVAGTLWTTWLHRRTVIWFGLDREPTPAEAIRAQRLPIDLAKVSGTLWLLGAVLIGGLTATVGTTSDALGVTLTILLGGLTTVGLTYLGSEQVALPVLTEALAAHPPGEKLPVTVLSRLLLTWSLAGGVPMLGVLLVAAPPDLGRGDTTTSLIVLSSIGIVVGAIGSALLARGVAAPLHRLRLVLDQVAKGRTDVRVPVDDSSEIGMLQKSVNDLVAGLREQDRMRDLFGRHVGTDVARHALEHGASLSGEVREVTALFVDVVDSTALAYRIPPEELVGKLNRFFGAVVAAVGRHGGLVNKFQGDAALCIFGAPTALADQAGSALAAARAIRDEIREADELDLGIGVASGPVFAGQLGTSSRFEYTVIGDAVNEAARLTESAKQVPGRVLASDAVLAACTERERANWSRHGEILLRGRQQATLTWAD